MTTINPFLWFDKQAEEAANFYCSVFKDSKITAVTRAAADNLSNQKGEVMTVAFELNGQPFVALNGGPQFKFNESISFVINCETSQDVDYY
jgi:predicted 3-demethylubiquinone-9 3-methyltransferase (glyoxalase superfamily)